jgi:alanine-synthesizing transaminase
VFSSRLPSSLIENRIAAALANRRSAGLPVLDLTESNPTAAGFRYPEAAIAGALGDARALRYEPSAFGLPSAREAVARYYADRGFSVPVDRLALTASTSEAYAYLFKLLCDPGDEVLVPRPSYPLFEFLAHLESVRVVQYPLFYDCGWHLDLHDLESRVTKRTRAVVLVNPNNPTGSYLKRREWEDLSALCAARKLAVISDEVFSDYAFDDNTQCAKVLAATAGEALCFSLSGLSKVAGLPQLKLGWMAAGGHERLVAEAWRKLELIADTYLSVGTPAQIAAPALLAAGQGIRAQISARTRVNLDALRRAAQGTALSVLDVEGGWYATVQVPRIRSEEEWVLTLLDEHGVLVQPGFFYDFGSEAFLVLSLLTPPREFAAGMERLLQAI